MIINNLCASYSEDGSCTLCNHIRAALVYNIARKLYECNFINNGLSICEKSNDGCNCVSC